MARATEKDTDSEEIKWEDSEGIDAGETGSVEIDSVSHCPLNLCNGFIRMIHALSSLENDREATAKHLWALGKADNWGGGPEDSWSPFYAWEQVMKAVDAGCPTCRLFRDAVLCFFPGNRTETADDFGNSGLYFGISCKTDGLAAFRTSIFFTSQSNIGPYRVKLYAPEDSEPCAWPLPKLPVSRRDLGPEGKLAHLNSWLTNCRKCHTSCQSYNGSKGDRTSLPKRVLDVSSPGGQLRLYEPKNEMSQYICLSHCWGESQPLTTTLANIEGFKCNIPWEAVPQTFKDAIEIARKLSIRYLWIDSLCIVQDDRKDWEEQAALMCEVYSNAFLTIFATRCIGCSDTLFRSFNEPIRGYDENGSLLAVAVRVECSHLQLRPADNRYPLLTRAWAFQERLLSRRIVHFGYDELFWECMENTCCECAENIVGSPLPIKSIRYRDPYQAMQKDYQRIWHEIVQGYTALKLTHRSDRQPAILGLAREMARKRRGRYLEGLWEDSLITDLAWRVGWTLDITQRIKGEDGGTKGPSWSWTSIDAPCKYWGNWVDGDTTVLNIKSSDPSDSRQTHTLLTVRGRLVSGTSNHYEYGPYGMRISSELWFCSSFGVSPADESAYFKPDVNCPPFVPDGEPVFCLALGFSSYFSHKFEVGLVLRCIDSKEQFFERIGIFDLKLSGPNEVAHKLLATQELATINLV